MIYPLAPRIRTMANLFDALAAPASQADFNAAIAARASRLTNRCRPLPKVPHGFYDPDGFVAACRARSERERFRRETFAKLAQRSLLRSGGVK